MTNYIPVNEPLLNGNEKKYLMECIDSGWISSEGPYVKKFEENIASCMERKYAISVTSGTAALEIAIAALELSTGDEVIMPTFTIISCAIALTRQGCVPVLVDSDPLNWNMDVDQIEGKITSRTKAIMLVHIYGLPVNMEPVFKLAEKYGLKIIEDAAQMHGQIYKGKPCGSFGDISTLSFYPNKHITSGEGGMVLTDSDRLAKRSASLKNLCFKSEKRFFHDELGFNFRMTNLQAAVGLAQAERLGEFVKRKRMMGKKYTELLNGIAHLQLPLPSTEYADNIYWVYGIVLKDEVPFDAEYFIKKLSKRHIGSRPFFWCMHEQPVFQKMGLFKDERYPVAEKIARRGFYIPSGMAITDKQIYAVSEAINAIIDEDQ